MENQLVGLLNADADPVTLVEDGVVLKARLHAMMKKRCHDDVFLLLCVQLPKNTLAPNGEFQTWRVMLTIKTNAEFAGDIISNSL